MTDPATPTLKDLSKMLVNFGIIMRQSNALTIELLKAGANPIAIAATVREQQATLAGYLTAITAMVDLMRVRSGESLAPLAVLPPMPADERDHGHDEIGRPL